MHLVDIAAMYRRHPNPPKKPFSYFFTSRGFQMASQYLRDAQQLPEHEIAVRTMPHRGSPSIAKVHPLVALEFLRWLDYGKFHESWLKVSGEPHE